VHTVHTHEYWPENFGLPLSRYQSDSLITYPFI
jgi:hypothetical protein